MWRRIGRSSRGCKSAWSRPDCSKAKPLRLTRRPSRRTRRCGASCGGTPARVTSDSSRGWRPPRASRRPPARRWSRLDRRRKKRTSNAEWVNPSDPDAKVAKMKDGRTHLAHKAEHAVDLETGALVAVTLHGADVGDTTSLLATALAAGEQREAAQATVPRDLVGDKGYHSNETLLALAAIGR